MELRPNSKVYIDTNLFIYYFENNPQYGNKVKNLFETLIEQNIKIISSELLYLELLVLPYKINNKNIIDLYTNIEKHIPNLQLIKLDKKHKMVRLSRSFRFKRFCVCSCSTKFTVKSSAKATDPNNRLS